MIQDSREACTGIEDRLYAQQPVVEMVAVELYKQDPNAARGYITGVPDAFEHGRLLGGDVEEYELRRLDVQATGLSALPPAPPAPTPLSPRIELGRDGIPG